MPMARIFMSTPPPACGFQYCEGGVLEQRSEWSGRRRVEGGLDGTHDMLRRTPTAQLHSGAASTEKNKK